MKLIMAVSIIALTLTTGFTCSKNTPEAPKVEAPAQQDPASAGQPSQEQMAQPAMPNDGAPTDGAPATLPTDGENK